MRENKELQTELALLSQQQATLEREAFELSGKRDAKAREYAKAVANRRDAEEEMKVKDIMILDLSKRSHNLASQLKECTKLYELVKNERNKAVNMIQTSQQAAAEMKEKIGILQNEIEILQNETNAKEKALGDEHKACGKAVGERDTVRSDVNKLLLQYKEKQQQVDQKVSNSTLPYIYCSVLSVWDVSTLLKQGGTAAGGSKGKRIHVLPCSNIHYNSLYMCDENTLLLQYKEHIHVHCISQYEYEEHIHVLPSSDIHYNSLYMCDENTLLLQYKEHIHLHRIYAAATQYKEHIHVHRVSQFVLHV